MSSDNNQDQQLLLRKIPAVDNLLQRPLAAPLIAQYGRSLVLEGLRSVLDEERHLILNQQASGVTNDETIIQKTQIWLDDLFTPSLFPVINATGIIVHTNLGRAPLSEAAMNSILEVSAGYSTLEYDPENGLRGSRTVHAESLITRLTGAEAALVVNNNAAAVLLMLTALCKDREVIISRGQLIEIGGGFRVPDVMAQSGAKLVEVGTTNRTHLRDYESAINENTAAILVAHHSNYKIIGFTTEPGIPELAELAHNHHIPLLYDQGSGALADVTPYGLDPEPTVQEGLASGVDVITFSGDKLLGGPQAGILCGDQLLLNELKRHPLARAVRADKLCLSSLSVTLNAYLRGDYIQKIPVWTMLAREEGDLLEMANSLAEFLQANLVSTEIIDGQSRVGGGSLPGTSLPTKLVAIESKDPQGLARRLRQGKMPVISRIQADRVLLDPRTVLPFQVDQLLETLVEACGQYERN